MKPIMSFTTALIALVMLAIAPVRFAQAQVKVTSAAPAGTSQGTVSLDVIIDGRIVLPPPDPANADGERSNNDR
jgi:uncharacterized lipoprotein YbaY